MNKYFFVIFWFIFIAIFISCGGRDENRYKPEIVNGPLIFHQACANCHGGTNNIGSKLVNTKLTVAQIKKVISNGKGAMPRFPLITGEALQELAKFVAKMK